MFNEKLTTMKALRNELGLSFDDIAKKTKISRQHIHNIENGKGSSKVF
jgi:DNA-binding XRE family transcriptional regulator